MSFKNDVLALGGGPCGAERVSSQIDDCPTARPRLHCAQGHGTHAAFPIFLGDVLHVDAEEADQMRQGGSDPLGSDDLLDQLAGPCHRVDEDQSFVSVLLRSLGEFEGGRRRTLGRLARHGRPLTRSGLRGPVRDCVMITASHIDKSAH